MGPKLPVNPHDTLGKLCLHRDKDQDGERLQREVSREKGLGVGVLQTIYVLRNSLACNHGNAVGFHGPTAPCFHLLGQLSNEDNCHSSCICLQYLSHVRFTSSCFLFPKVPMPEPRPTHCPPADPSISQFPIPLHFSQTPGHSSQRTSCYRLLSSLCPLPRSRGEYFLLQGLPSLGHCSLTSSTKIFG